MLKAFAIIGIVCGLVGCVLWAFGDPPAPFWVIPATIWPIVCLIQSCKD